MAKKKKRRGVKIYKPHSVGTIIYAIFGLGVIACLVLFALMPMFSCVKEGEDTIAFTGLEFFEYCFRKFIGGILPMPAQNAPFEAYINNETSNILLQNIQKFHEFIEWGIGGLFAFSLLWCVFELILALLMLIFGKSRHPKGIKTFGWLIFWFFAIGYGLAYMYFVFIMQIGGDGLVIKPDNLSLIALGAMFACGLVLTGIYRIYLKDRIALPKKKKKHDDDDEEEEEKPEEPKPTEPKPIEEKPEEPKPAEEKPVEPKPEEPKPEANPRPVTSEATPTQPVTSETGNESIITVGNTAYKKNTDITVANIPEGIAILGSSAFADCLNLVEVNLPASLREISFECFKNTPKLVKINYAGTVELWKTIKRDNNWLAKSGTTKVNCKDGQINVNPSH